MRTVHPDAGTAEAGALDKTGMKERLGGKSASHDFPDVHAPSAGKEFQFVASAMLTQREIFSHQLGLSAARVVLTRNDASHDLAVKEKWPRGRSAGLCPPPTPPPTTLESAQAELLMPDLRAREKAEESIPAFCRFPQGR